MSRSVDVLVRPERLRFAAPGDTATPSNRLAIKVNVIVNYGDAVLVIGDAHGHVVRVRMAGAPPAAVREGATVTVSWDPGDAHLIVRP
jgi:hypothetical protein